MKSAAERTLGACDSCIVLMLAGWQDSLGVAKELDYFTAIGAEIDFHTMQDLMDMPDVPQS